MRTVSIEIVLTFSPTIPVAINGNMTMPGWYNIYSLDKNDPQHDEEGIMKTKDQIIQSEIDSGIDPSRIIISGFSQGAVMSLVSGLSFPKKLGGIMAMSGYLPMPTKFKSLIYTENANTPIVMFHGKEDTVVEYEWGLDAYNKLKEMGIENIKFHSFEMMGHSACDDELVLMVEFVKEQLSKDTKRLEL